MAVALVSILAATWTQTTTIGAAKNDLRHLENERISNGSPQIDLHALMIEDSSILFQRFLVAWIVGPPAVGQHKDGGLERAAEFLETAGAALGDIQVRLASQGHLLPAPVRVQHNVKMYPWTHPVLQIQRRRGFAPLDDAVTLRDLAQKYLHDRRF